MEDDFVEGVEGRRCYDFPVWGCYSDAETVAEEDAGCAGWAQGGSYIWWPAFFRSDCMGSILGNGRCGCGLFGREYGMSRRGRPGRVELPESSLMLCEFPFVEEAESAHAEGQYRRDGGRSSEEGGCTEDRAIAPEGCG